MGIQQQFPMPSIIFFLTITGNLKLHQVGRNDAISVLTDKFPTKFPGIKNIPTTKTEIIP
jgi:hypothetical protein